MNNPPAPPADKPQAKQKPVPQLKSKNAGGSACPSLLIVDDLKGIHEMLKLLVTPAGFNVSYALDGEEALELYRKGKYDVVLTDIVMQPMDGITLLRNIRKLDPSAVVVVMTGFKSRERVIMALRYGAFDFIQKPFNAGELLDILKQAAAAEGYMPETAADIRAKLHSKQEEAYTRSTKMLGEWPTLEDFLSASKNRYLKDLLLYCKGNVKAAAQIADTGEDEFEMEELSLLHSR